MNNKNKKDYSLTEQHSIFYKYYERKELHDRYLEIPEEGVDVIIPIVHSTELWENNLHSIYSEIPVKRLLISDGGCIDNSIEIVSKFPRVEILDHKEYKTLGYCLRELILKVEAEWFIYLHSDVYLPVGWYETMKKYKNQYDWYGCPQQITVMAEYLNRDKMNGEIRPYAGSQIGKKEAFLKYIETIDDDFVYRQEDFVLANIVEKAGYKQGFVEDTFHYHQVVHKDSPFSRKIKSVKVEVEWSDAERIRIATMQLKGVVKYLEPRASLIKEVETSIQILKQYNAFKKDEFLKWVNEVNPIWTKNISFLRILKYQFYQQIKNFINLLRGRKDG